MMGAMESGERIVGTNLVGTVGFTVSSVLAAAVFTDPFRIAGVVVSLMLFAIGIFGFIWSYITAVSRSRTDNIAVAQLYFLASGSTPKRIKRLMMGALTVQVVVALATAITRSTTNGRSGSTLAFGILVPMFGLGLNGLWCSKHGSFALRAVPGARSSPDPGQNVADESDPLADPDRSTSMESATDPAGVPLSDDEMEQNSPHG